MPTALAALPEVGLQHHTITQYQIVQQYPLPHILPSVPPWSELMRLTDFYCKKAKALTKYVPLFSIVLALPDRMLSVQKEGEDAFL